MYMVLSANDLGDDALLRYVKGIVDPEFSALGVFHEFFMSFFFFFLIDFVWVSYCRNALQRSIYFEPSLNTSLSRPEAAEKNFERRISDVILSSHMQIWLLA